MLRSPLIGIVGIALGAAGLGGGGVVGFALHDRCELAEREVERLQARLVQRDEARDEIESQLAEAQASAAEWRSKSEEAQALQNTDQETSSLLTTRLADYQQRVRELEAQAATLKLRDEQLVELRRELMLARGESEELAKKLARVSTAGRPGDPVTNDLADAPVDAEAPDDADAPNDIVRSAPPVRSAVAASRPIAADRDIATAPRPTPRSRAVPQPTQPVVLYDDSGWRSVYPAGSP